MLTKRSQNNHIMSTEEKLAFSETIRKMPWLYAPILNALSSTSGKTLCDIACGDGYLLELIHQQYPHYSLTGIDIDEYFINKAKKVYPFKFIHQDAISLKGHYDVITSNLALHHFDEPISLIKHLTTKTNKTLLISDQIRPKTQAELEERISRRTDLVASFETSYYKNNEKASILESYSEKEIIDIFSNFDCKLNIIDQDYYKRFVATFKMY